MQAADFFTLPTSLAIFSTHFAPTVEPWDWIKKIAVAFAANPAVTERPVVPPGVHIEGSVYLHPTVKLPHAATIIGPAWIGARTEIRPGAYIRGNVIVGEDCVLGNACEFKNCLLMDRVQVPHFNYVGDSILGNDSHLGAGAICSNFRLDQREIVVQLNNRDCPTGLRKFGAIIGEKAEVGCNAVLMPGTLLGRRALVMPLTPFGGYLEEGTIARDRPSISKVARRD